MSGYQNFNQVPPPIQRYIQPQLSTLNQINTEINQVDDLYQYFSQVSNQAARDDLSENNIELLGQMLGQQNPISREALSRATLMEVD